MRSIIFLLSILSSSALQAAEPNEPPCPLSHGKWEPMPAFSDEFNGTSLDMMKWINVNPAFPGLPHGPFDQKNVREADGLLQLDSKLMDAPGTSPAVHEYTTASIASKERVRYGYFEVRAKSMDSQVCSAFWFYDSTPEEWTEIDVFEINGREVPHIDHMNMHVFNTLYENERWDETKRWAAPFNFSKDYHVFGLEWSADELVWYVDGHEQRREKNTHWHQPLAMQFDSEIKPNWFGLPDNDSLPAIFLIDYVRSWRRLDVPADERPLAVQFRFPGRPQTDKESLYRLKTDGTGTIVVHVNGGSEIPGNVYIEYIDPAFFTAATEPDIQKKITLRDTAGKNLEFAIQWQKPTGLASLWSPKSLQPTVNGYAPCGIEFTPEPKKMPGTVDEYSFKADDGTAIRVTVTWPRLRD